MLPRYQVQLLYWTAEAAAEIAMRWWACDYLFAGIAVFFVQHIYNPAGSIYILNAIIQAVAAVP